ncbi:nucleoside phosphorylase domain-containing protein [Trichoderma evansii]
MVNRTRRRDYDEINNSPSAAKRQKMSTSNTLNTSGYQPEDYTVSWICALHIEMAAARAMLDHIHNDLPAPPNDINTYTLGSIGSHNVVIACLPNGYYGTNNAATVASNIERSYPSIEIHLMVGVGGGAPGRLDIRLGDIVVGSRVMQYDLGKIVGEGQIERTSFFGIPPSKLLTHISKLRAVHESTATRVPVILQEMHNKYPMMTEYAHPNAQDRLFHAGYDHNPAAASCDECDASMLVQRPPRTNSHPKIHYQAIASGNKVMKHGLTRDKIAQELQVACFEMEAAGLMNFPVARVCSSNSGGIC